MKEGLWQEGNGGRIIKKDGMKRETEGKEEGEKGQIMKVRCKEGMKVKKSRREVGWCEKKETRKTIQR